MGTTFAEQLCAIFEWREWPLAKRAVERSLKSSATAPITWYIGSEAELDQVSGLTTSYVTPQIKRVGFSGKTGFSHQDHLGSNRAVIYPYFGISNQGGDYGPYGAPLGTPLNGRAYINERAACPRAGEAGPGGRRGRPAISARALL